METTLAIFYDDSFLFFFLSLSQGSIRIWRLLYPTADPVDMMMSPNAASSPNPMLRRHTVVDRGQASPLASPMTPIVPPPMVGTPTVECEKPPRGPHSLGIPFLTIEFIHRLEAFHDAPVTALHTSPHDWKRLWSGDRNGRVQTWQISSDEHWLKDNEAKNCQACQIKFSVLERRHRQITQT